MISKSRLIPSSLDPGSGCPFGRVDAEQDRFRPVVEVFPMPEEVNDLGFGHTEIIAGGRPPCTTIRRTGALSFGAQIIVTYATRTSLPS
jgi:hypothetical protein